MRPQDELWLTCALRLGPGLNIERGHWTSLAHTRAQADAFRCKSQEFAGEMQLYYGPAPGAFLDHGRPCRGERPSRLPAACSVVKRDEMLCGQERRILIAKNKITCYRFLFAWLNAPLGGRTEDGHGASARSPNGVRNTKEDFPVALGGARRHASKPRAARRKEMVFLSLSPVTH
jgi:hypothetical protein